MAFSNVIGKFSRADEILGRGESFVLFLYTLSCC